MIGPVDEQEYREKHRRELNARMLQVIRAGLARPRKTLRIILADPGVMLRGIRRLNFDRRAAGIRRRYEKAGLVVPPFLFLSVTTRCNLSCPGCFMRDRREQRGPEMTGDEIGSIATQAAGLGVTGIIILGGEPLLRWRDLLPIARSHPDILFPLFSNGLLVDEEIVADLSRAVNIIPFISIDGPRDDTDARRGDGVYDHLLDVCRLLDNRIPFFGVSVTVTRNNIDAVLEEPFTRLLLGTGAGAIAYLQWVPTDPGTEYLVLSPDQRHLLYEAVRQQNRRFPVLFIAAPGDVGKYGGCLAAGRGFAAINARGGLEPCVMVPHPVADLRVVPLQDALASPLFRAIRENHHLLKAHGRCRLRTDPCWLNSLLADSGGK